jgi:hypothetical protein
VVGLPYDIESAATSVSDSRDPRNSLEVISKVPVESVGFFPEFTPSRTGFFAFGSE